MKSTLHATGPHLPWASWRVGRPPRVFCVPSLSPLPRWAPQNQGAQLVFPAMTAPSVCRDRKWNCTDHVCDATCSMIGMAHYLTFDGLKYMFPGECQYVLVQVRRGEMGRGRCLFLGGGGWCGLSLGSVGLSAETALGLVSTGVFSSPSQRCLKRLSIFPLLTWGLIKRDRSLFVVEDCCGRKDTARPRWIWN